MIRKHRHRIVRRNNHKRVREAARRFGIWLATMALVIACIAGAGILLAPAKAEGPPDPALERHSARQPGI
mgnify:CR=1 FL=1